MASEGRPSGVDGEVPADAAATGPQGSAAKPASGPVISTAAGTGTLGLSGDGGPATEAQLGDPSGLASDGAGNLYIADYGNDRLRKMTVS